MHLTDRNRDARLGLAVGDGLGTTFEFKRQGTLAPITDILGGGPFNLEPGQWTDDASMALCLAESLNAPLHQDRNARWASGGRRRWICTGGAADGIRPQRDVPIHQ